MVAAQAGVTKSVPPGERVSGYPARRHSAAKRLHALRRASPEAGREGQRARVPCEQARERGRCSAFGRGGERKRRRARASGRGGLMLRTQQRTLKRGCSYTGIGIHTGQQVTVSFGPAPPDHGIVFVRTDLPDSPEVPASIRYVAASSDNPRRTTLSHNGVKISTVEHVLAALARAGHRQRGRRAGRRRTRRADRRQLRVVRQHPG